MTTSAPGACEQSRDAPGGRGSVTSTAATCRTGTYGPAAGAYFVPGVRCRDGSRIDAYSLKTINPE
jgi:hypothetical protein